MSESRILDGGWEPILEGDLAHRARSLAIEFAEGVVLDGEVSHSPSLVNGDAGLVLVFAQMALEFTEELAWGERTVFHIQRALDGVSQRVLGPGLYGGFTGVGWSLEHLRRVGLLHLEVDLNAAIDAALLPIIERPSWDGPYDLVFGLVGMGAYALTRIYLPEGRRLVDGVLARLEETAIRDESGLAWFTPKASLSGPQQERCPEGGFPLGVSHGIAGVISFLGRADSFGFERAGPLLQASLRWLLAHRNPPDLESTFGTTIPFGRPWVPNSSRTAWCNGDLGIAVALLGAARSMGDSDIERLALDLGRRSALCSKEKCGVLDPAVCHGAAGVGHLFNRLYQSSGEEPFRAAATDWFRAALDMHESAPTWWEGRPALMDGRGGVCLALLAATGRVEPEWDRILLADMPLTAPGKR